MIHEIFVNGFFKIGLRNFGRTRCESLRHAHNAVCVPRAQEKMWCPQTLCASGFAGDANFAPTFRERARAANLRIARDAKNISLLLRRDHRERALDDVIHVPKPSDSLVSARE